MPGEDSGLLGSYKFKLLCITATMALVPILLMSAMVFTGHATVEQWAALTWKLFGAGVGAPGTGAIIMRGVEGYAAKRDVPPRDIVSGNVETMNVANVDARPTAPGDKS